MPLLKDSEEAYLFADIATTHLPEKQLLSELAPAQSAKLNTEWLLRLHRADPSASLDKCARWRLKRHRQYLVVGGQVNR